MSGNKGHFEKGNKAGTGGARENAGRKPNWFKALCEAELEKDEAAGAKLIGKIYRGEAEFEQASVSFGKVIKYKLKASARDVVAAGEFLRDSSQGRPAQAIQHSGDVGVDIFDLIDKAEQERGLPRSFDDK